MKYYIEIAGVGKRKIVEVEANSREEAFDKTREMYDKDYVAFLFDRTENIREINKHECKSDIKNS